MVYHFIRKLLYSVEGSAASKVLTDCLYCLYGSDLCIPETNSELTDLKARFSLNSKIVEWTKCAIRVIGTPLRLESDSLLSHKSVLLKKMKKES